MDLRQVRCIEHRRISGTEYAYYAIPLPPTLAPLWSGAHFSIENRGNTLVIQRVAVVR